ncbi:MAG: hypothetical protein U0636_03840 [Phycisphaerales bacterium]
MLGNGGNWFELVVVADHVDMRGWKARVGGQDCLGRHPFSLAEFALSDMRAGTILTFYAQNTTAQEQDTDLTYSPGTGDNWININTFDTALVSRHHVHRRASLGSSAPATTSGRCASATRLARW